METSENHSDEEIDGIKRKLRILAILDAAENVGIVPISVADLHVIAYFADVLAPVWDLPVLDAIVLKQLDRPFFPILQHDLDLLVGSGVVQATRVEYVLDASGATRIDADYSLHRDFADPILSEMRAHKSQSDNLAFVREVVYAVSAFGVEGIGTLSRADAAYSDPLVDIGGLIEIDGDNGENPSAEVAMRFRELDQFTDDLSDSEIVHLYVRHLYTRMQVA